MSCLTSLNRPPGKPLHGQALDYAACDEVRGGNGWTEAGRPSATLPRPGSPCVNTSGFSGIRERGAYPAVRGAPCRYGGREEATLCSFFRIGGTHARVTVQAHRTIWWSLQIFPEFAVNIRGTFCCVRLWLSMVGWWIRLVALVPVYSSVFPLEF